MNYNYMAKHHSLDYKLSAINYYIKHNSYRKTCKIFQCSKSSLQRWKKQYNINKTLPRKKTRKKYNFTKEQDKYLIVYINKHANVTLKQLTKIFNKKYKTKYNYISIYKNIRTLNFTHKRLRNKYFPSKKNEKEELLKFYKELTKYDKKKVISIDETAFYINMTKEKGWSKKGKRAILKTNIYPFKKFNVLCAIKYGKVIAIKIYKEREGLDKYKFIHFLKMNIKDKYKNHLITMDNARFHRTDEVRNYITDMNNNFLYTIPYHPENNAIENFFNQLKHYIKLESPQSYDELVKVTNKIIKENIKKDNLKNYFKYLYLQGNNYIKHNAKK